eukprot:gene9970-10993_t
MCDLKITPIGCYHDGQTNRPLPLLLDSHRDVTSRAFHGEVIDWRNGEKSFRKLACDCATKTRKAGYTHFGLQFYGECWSSKTAAKDYKKDGDADTCLNGKYKECKPGEFCVGQSMTNYVYRIEPITPRPCTTKFEKVGCFYDPVNTKHRPLPDLLDSNRDITSHAHHGDLLDWGNYRASLEKLVCHCAERAKKRGHTHFGIEYYGECWSGKNSSKTYNKYGSSKNCVNPAFAKCDPKSDCLCTGKGFALFPLAKMMAQCWRFSTVGLIVGFCIVICLGAMCDLKITPIGCYHDTQTNRPLPLLLDSHRDVTSHAYHGEVFDWRNGEKSIRKLACDCATKTRKAGYTHFGLQFYGECWSSKTAAKDYKKDGYANSCVNGKYKKCIKGEFCVGQSMTNYVYRIDPLTTPGSICTTKFEKVGCFHDPVKTKHRPLPELLDSHRDITSHAHHGHLVNWNNYRASLEKLVCHCAERAKKRGHTHFGIEYYGECWSGKHSSKTYNKYGPSKNCVNTGLAKCDPKSNCLCAGKGFALFVYKVK